MKNYFLLAFLFATQLLLAQSKDKKIFLDSLWNQTNEGNHKYYRITTDYYLNKKGYQITDFYLNGQIKNQGSYEDKDGNGRIGQHKEYYSSGRLKTEKNYAADNRPSGPFNSFYENGNKEIEGEYVKIKTDVVEEHSILKVISYWDENGTQRIIEGNGTMIEKSEKETSRGKLVNGFKEGTWIGTNPSKKVQFVDKYESGIFIAGVSKDSTNTEFGYLEINKMPAFKTGLMDFYKYVGKNFNKPDTETIKGKLITEFTIGTEGQIQDVKIIKGLRKDLDIEAIRLIMSTDNSWNPGEYRGIKTEIKNTFPIVIDIKVN
ncbi:energy transducer TonB [Flavobacterium sp.]|uniref:energy transducer TonB n=1 Tax=Flavobacterium sp. TaxID=239 RepID=UPI00262E673F|nr:energy transducer TonB [Flavobacterium sp.]